MAELIPYDPTIHPADTERATQTMGAALLPDARKPRVIRVDGNCPRCGHPTWARHYLVVVRGVEELDEAALEALADAADSLGLDRSRGDEVFDVSCRCGQEHPDHPENDLSCGSRWQMRVIWP